MEGLTWFVVSEEENEGTLLFVAAFFGFLRDIIQIAIQTKEHADDYDYDVRCALHDYTKDVEVDFWLQLGGEKRALNL